MGSSTSKESDTESKGILSQDSSRTLNGSSHNAVTSSSSGEKDDLSEVIDTQGSEEQNEGGMKMVTAMVFVVGEMAGSGVLALPKAVDSLGWVGLVLIVICGLLAAYTGSILGKCWIILREVYPEYRSQTRYPYPSIGYRTYNKVGRYVITISMHATFVGVSVVFILIASEMIQQLLQDLNVHISFCYWMVIIVAVLTPFTWLGSPKDMWPIAVGALGTTAVACVIIVVKSILMQEQGLTHVTHSSVEFKPALLSLGTILYAFGNHPIFPTIQHDMKEPRKFSVTVLLGFLGVLCMYVPVTAAGYFIFGSSVDDNVLTTIYNISNGPALYIVQILLVFHLMFGYVIILNPLSQELEDALNIKHSFNFKRIICRTCITCVTLFLAESIPKFGNILSLIGGSTTALLAFVCPVLFYNKLCDSIGRHIPLHQRIFHYEIIVIAVIIGIASTYAAIEAIVSPNSFVPPCYVSVSAAGG